MIAGTLISFQRILKISREFSFYLTARAPAAVAADKEMMRSGHESAICRGCGYCCGACALKWMYSGAAAAAAAGGAGGRGLILQTERDLMTSERFSKTPSKVLSLHRLENAGQQIFNYS